MSIELVHGFPVKDDDPGVDVTFLENNVIDSQEAVTFIDKSGLIWAVEKGFVSDGASIPRWAWSIIGHPFYGKSLVAALLHDKYCITKVRPHKKVHRMFYEAMVLCGEKKHRAWIMYLAVKIGGPKWRSKK